ncbi:MAG: hypothetical protein JSU96_10035, partial [Acidobacteriota bacterium]
KSLAVLLFAFLQFLSVSFALPFNPPKLAIGSIPEDSDYTSMAREWVFYESEYFGVAGPPQRSSWQLEAILEPLQSNDRVAFVPDAPFFHQGALSLLGIEQGKKLQTLRMGATLESLVYLDRCDWVVGKTGGQGLSYGTLFSQQVYDELESRNWPLVNVWQLPDRTEARLWRNPARPR